MLLKNDHENKMMVLDDLKDQIPLRKISRISGISLSGYYYKPRERHIQRIDPTIKEKIRNVASERPTYGYRRVWAILRNHGTKVNRKTVRKVLKGVNLSLPASKHRGRTNSRNLFKPIKPDQLWETDITNISTESGMTYLMCIKDTFTKEWQEYNYSRSCMARDAIRSVENALLMAFNGTVPEGLVLRKDNWPQYISHEFVDFHDGSIANEKAFSDYNECRLHLFIDYLPPREFRRKFLNDPAFRERFEKKEVEVRLNE